LQNFGAVIASLGIGVVGILILPIPFNTERSKDMVRTAGFLGAAMVNVWLVHFPPQDVPLLTYTLPTDIVQQMLSLTNSFLLGPVLVAIFAVTLNLVMSSPPVYEVPFVRWSNPERQPIVVVVASAFVGTLFYLAVQGIVTGEYLVVPELVSKTVM
jgi:RsiW-degrading membrane proteinase PrsW (M82 family)